MGSRGRKPMRALVTWRWVYWLAMRTEVTRSSQYMRSLSAPKSLFTAGFSLGSTTRRRVDAAPIDSVPHSE